MNTYSDAFITQPVY